MGSDVGKQVARRLGKIEKEIRAASRPAVNKAALVLKQAVDREIVAATGDRKLSGVGRGGTRVGVRYDVKGTRNPTAIIKALGPLHLIERGTKAHEIRPKRRGRGRRRVLSFNGGVVAYVRRHPGTRGKRPFEKGIARGREPAIKAMREAQTDALKRGFR